MRIDLRQIGEQVQSLLPYQVRRAVSLYPVMLFTAGKCPPCNTAREFLAKRGIPFAERTIETGDDSVELKRLTLAEGVPVATVGTASLIGFDPDEWNITLDASGYPKTSQLTVTFKQEPARPLTKKEDAASGRRSSKPNLLACACASRCVQRRLTRLVFCSTISGRFH